MSEPPILLEMVRKASRRRALSRKTENAYVNQIGRFQQFYVGRDLQEVGKGGVDAFLEYLEAAKNLAVSTRNQALSALTFLYRDVFGQKEIPQMESVKRVKPRTKTPVIFTPEEVRAVLSKMRGDTLLVAALMYGAGLRLSEAVALRVGDIDFERREIVVRDARTGAKDRTTMLPEMLIRQLKRHLINVRYIYEDDYLANDGKIFLPAVMRGQNSDTEREWKKQFAFPSHNLTFGKSLRRNHLAESTVQKAVTEAILKANVLKEVCCQTFRYSFAARLFEKNHDIRRIQNLLGHKNLKTTAVYMNFARYGAGVVRSPLDI